VDILHIKVVITDKSKKLNSEDGGNFEKKREGSYILTIRNYDVGRNYMHEQGHTIHDYLFGEPGDNSLPYALENAFTLWWQEHHGIPESKIEFIEDKSVDESVDALVDK
jgi:hypothetical protein